MSESRLISVVVPVYGVRDYLPQCIESLLSQRHERVEIILVNDGSPDGSGEICDGYAALDRRIRVVHKINGGLVSARKAGVRIATGEYLGFVDGDDWVGDDFFEMLHDRAESASADLVISGHIREFFGKCEPIAPRSDPGVYDREAIAEELLPTAMYNGTFFQHGVSTYVWNKLFRRPTASAFVNDIDESIVMGEDAALTYPYLAASRRVVVFESGSYFYRQRSNSIVKSVPDIAREYRRLSALFRYLAGRFAGCEREAQIRQQLRYYFYAQVLVRSGAVIASGRREPLIPFPGLRPGQRVVVYSSGSFGQLVFRALDRLQRYRLVGWVDEDDHESQRCGLPVTSVDSISDLAFDLLIVAAVDTEYAAQVSAKLQAKGVERSRISVLDVDFEGLDGQLRDVGFDTECFAFLPRPE